ncbi:hypothetical protein ACLI4Z_05895 [Natrialbaceae archaeon A-arb3/5]
MDDVSYVDTAAMAAENEDALCAFLTNRNLRERAEVTLVVSDAYEDAAVDVTVQQPTGDPHDEQDGVGDAPEAWYDWTDLEVYEIDEFETAVSDGSVTVELEPSAVARVELDAESSDSGDGTLTHQDPSDLDHVDDDVDHVIQWEGSTDDTDE